MAADYQLFLSVPRGISTSVISQPRPWRSQAMSRGYAGYFFFTCTGCACFKCVIILLTATSRWNAQVLSLGTNPGVLHFPGANSDLVSLVSLRPDMTCCISSMESRIRHVSTMSVFSSHISRIEKQSARVVQGSSGSSHSHL